MNIEYLSLRQFRNYESLEIRPNDGINLIFGQNGAGKTNILEAIHYCALGKSHRVNQDHDTVMKGKNSSICTVKIETKNANREICLHLTPEEEKKKTVYIDKKKSPRISEMIGILQCVIFSPEDLDIIKDGPGVRRRFIDMMISQISPSYFSALQKYKSYLEQKNALLRSLRIGNQNELNVLDVYDQQLASLSETIIQDRKNNLKIISDIASNVYCSICGRETEMLSVSYQTAIRNEGHDDILKQIVQAREDDIRYGMCTIGPHRDDLIMKLNGQSMKVFASQGQIRTAALSMKLAEMHLFETISGDTPVLLLDDVMSELDMNRRMKLLKEIEHVQTFITCTDESDLCECETKRVYSVENNKGAAKVSEINNGPLKDNHQITDPLFV